LFFISLGEIEVSFLIIDQYLLKFYNNSFYILVGRWISSLWNYKNKSYLSIHLQQRSKPGLCQIAEIKKFIFYIIVITKRKWTKHNMHSWEKDLSLMPNVMCRIKWRCWCESCHPLGIYFQIVTKYYFLARVWGQGGS